MRTGALAATALLVATAVSACNGDGTDASASDPIARLAAQKIAWKACAAPTPLQGGRGRPAPMADGTRWECGTMSVPLDWVNPDGKLIRLALIRARAKDADQRIGSLVFNFGGPGGSGVTTLPLAAKDQYKKLHERYDLVSFDPRGVGASAPVHCLGDKARDLMSATTDGTPDNAEEMALALAANAASVKACRKNSGDVLPHVDTASAARDMDLLRQVLGDDKLHYFGTSYGTELGAVYAHLFPKNVGRAVLDAVMDPTQGPEERLQVKVKSFQVAFEHFMTACAKTDGDSCPTGPDPKRGTEKITDLLERLDSKPLPTKSGRELTQEHARGAIGIAMFSKDFWAPLKKGLLEAQEHGTGNILLALSDMGAGRSPQGHYSNMGDANTAVLCADEKQRLPDAYAKSKVPEYRAVSPVFGESMAWSLSMCTGWPVEGKWEHPPVSAKGSAPIVLVGTTSDPATPFEGTRHMAEALGKDVAVTITNKGDGHGGYGKGKCVTKAVDTYLLDGTLPKEGTVCER
ncbi:alpha/beta hydrolase [Wenjunlia tyrosinilytica]|uniref:Peptidase n=1 Tax=Wenjunlia tyrosinilytica TaxID=1544741 RepID=A0A918E0M1_9ACTN|nr:alpha/beta hydrolase [Wenjunlia tyrosinilytica]GGO97618.1 peptidase [Wenjunlia tyrosinilytica]